jgi:hypothetical protein
VRAQEERFLVASLLGMTGGLRRGAMVVPE